MDYYYQFHKHQHYFLCHDILEDAWKSQNTFSKHDAVVSLQQLIITIVVGI